MSYRCPYPPPFVLQAGSFKGFDQADRRKAKLALLGVTAKIQRVTIYENEVWYRVRIGPFNDLKKLNNVRVLLNKNNINLKYLHNQRHV